jgi:tetratricopeptide (TPR) repeat protein
LRRDAIRRIALLMLGVVLAAQAGCASDRAGLKAANEAYQKHDYAGAFQKARQTYESGPGNTADEAAYLAGLSAHQLNDLTSAERYLRVAIASPDRRLAGDAYADLGVVYSQQERYGPAVVAFREAAGRMTGQDAANARFKAGIGLQKLGRWTEARTEFDQARLLSEDATFLRAVSDQAAVSAFTIQVAALSDEAAARKLGQQVTAAAKPLGLGAPRLLVSKDAAGRQLVLVQVGKFSNYESAASFRDRLGFRDAQVVAWR